MLGVLIVLIVLLLVFGGAGYGYRSSWGNYYPGGLGVLGTLVVILLVLWLIGAVKF
jgi:Protein of unknown function (DUF3309)